MRTTRTLGAISLGLALSLGLAACGEDGNKATETGSASTEAADHNDADVTFATDMIQHHAQALSMVDLTTNRPLDPEVQALAEDIRNAQAPEIETMTGWLTDWNEEVPDTTLNGGSSDQGMGDMEGMEGMDDMPGMMSADDMDALENASDKDFQDMWLEMMVEHHKGAIEMAQAEVANGKYQPAVDLAEQVVKTQTAEVATMTNLLGS